MGNKSSLALGVAALVVVAALLVAGRALWLRLPSRTRHASEVCLVPVEVSETTGSRVACANDADFKRCATILNAGDRVVFTEAGCTIDRNAMSAVMRLAEGLRLNLNTASAHDLGLVDGVDASTAASVVAWRDGHGPFRSIGDLDAIEGVGPATLSRLRATCEVLP